MVYAPSINGNYTEAGRRGATTKKRMKKTNRRRAPAASEKNGTARAPRPFSAGRSAIKTCKVAVPQTLHTATVVVAARGGEFVQDIVAAALRGNPEIRREEAAVIERSSL